MKLTEPAKGLIIMKTFALVVPGPTERVVILAIVLVLFGVKKLRFQKHADHN
jgi:hypothetical protein